MKYEFEACKQYNVNVRKIKQLLNELKLEKSGKTCNSIVVLLGISSRISISFWEIDSLWLKTFLLS